MEYSNERMSGSPAISKETASIAAAMSSRLRSVGRTGISP
jgi:hypothetical protein